jgi:energy-coupling factor transporter ATP-binding protein EcfA2/energy-coupling factor transporter transmembrane protein EcfT
VADLHVTYPSPLPGGPPLPALCGLDLDVERGEFLALMGAVGVGKTTLCLALNGAIPQAVDVEFQGRVIVCDQDTHDVPMGQLALQVGMVFADAESQLFNASAADEIAFGLEGMGVPPAEIERRIDEALAQVGLAGFRDRAPRSLSGGEQKRLALASVLVTHPQVLVLDEPTAGLDPRGRQHVLEAINGLRLAYGRDMTVIMATQDAEAAARFADRIVLMERGRVLLSGRPEQVFVQVDLVEEQGIAVPQLARLAHRLSEREGRRYAFLHLPQARAALAGWPTGQVSPPEPPPSPGSAGHQPGLPDMLAAPPSPESAGPQPGLSDMPAAPAVQEAFIEIRALEHHYPEAERGALRGVDLDIAPGEWLAVVGVNGAGKSTLVKHLNGLLHSSCGEVRVQGRDTRTQQVGELAHWVGYLPQNPDQLIFSTTVRQEVAYGPQQLGLEGPALERQVTETLAELNLLPLSEHPPAVLDYVTRRRVAMASVLAMRAPLLVLDEPTNGLDRAMIDELMAILSRRHREGMAIVMVTHDMDLVARYAERVIVLVEGRIARQGTPREVLADVEGLAAAGLEPLPVTMLGHALGWPAPLPLDVEDVLERLGNAPLPSSLEGGEAGPTFPLEAEPLQNRWSERALSGDSQMRTVSSTTAPHLRMLHSSIRSRDDATALPLEGEQSAARPSPPEGSPLEEGPSEKGPREKGQRGVLQRLDPRAKLLFVIGLFAYLALESTPASLLLVLLGLHLLAALSAHTRPRVGALWRSLLPLLVTIILLGSLSWRPREPLLALGPVGVTLESLWYAAGMAARIAALSLGLSLVLWTTGVGETVAALSRLGLPFVIGFPAVVALQYVTTFQRLFGRILEAQQSRGLTLPRGNPVRAARTYIPVLIPLLIGALRAADSLALALQSRGFGAGHPRSCRYVLRFGMRDALFLAALCAALFAASQV